MLRKVTMLALVAVMAVSASCGSIYAKRNSNMKKLYADDTARRAGDILTIIISESHKAGNKVSRNLKNNTQRSSSFNGDLGIKSTNSNILPRMPGFTMTASGDRTLKGQSDYKDERQVQDKITVVVEDVLENGNLVVVGSRQRDIAGDKQTIQVSGIVRPSDISFDNTVYSDHIANFKLVTISKGVSDKYNKPGWLANVFDVIWPF